MKHLLLSLAATFALTFAVFAQDVGNEAHPFTWIDNWTQLGDGVTNGKLGPTHGGIVVDKKGLVYCAMDTDLSILVLSGDGHKVRQFDKKYRGCHGLAINEEDGEEYIYAAHLAGRAIVKFKTSGEVVWEIKGLPEASGVPANRYRPTGVCVAPNGHVYVVDGYGSNHVFVFDKDQKFVKKFGERGKGDGQFTTCHGISLDTRYEPPLLLISDRENRRLQHFDLDGNFKAIVTTGLRRPCATSIFGDHVAIAELQGRVTILDKDNKQVAYPGDNPNKKQWASNGAQPKDWVPGTFTAPHGLSYDNEGNLIVMDWNRHGRITKLVRKKAGADKTSAATGTAAGTWVSMFNGKNLEGWKSNDEVKDVFTVTEHGEMKVSGGRAHIFYVGENGKADFKNFEFRAKVKNEPGSNSGIYFHTKFQDKGWPSHGYEAQVNISHKDAKKTGGLYAVADVIDNAPAKDNEWYDYNIRVEGKHIIVRINGVKTAEYVEPDEPEHLKKMPGRKLSSGTIAFQGHDPKSTVYYKDLEIMALP